MTPGTVGLEPVVIVGAGRAGHALAAACRAASLAHVLVDRTTVVAQQGPPVFDTRAAALARAGTLLLAVRDADLDAVLDTLCVAGAIPRSCPVLQVSGSAEPAARTRLEAFGMACGTFHPLLPLVDPAVASARLRGSVVGIEGAPAAQDAATALARAFGAATLEIPRAHRAAYHAAAVLASNFPVTLAALAEQVLGAIGVAPEAAHRAVRTLMAASVDNLEAAPRALDALTGPIVRGDLATVQAHEAALAGMPSVAAVYTALSRVTMALVEARRLTP